MPMFLTGVSFSMGHWDDWLFRSPKPCELLRPELNMLLLEVLVWWNNNLTLLNSSLKTESYGFYSMPIAAFVTKLWPFEILILTLSFRIFDEIFSKLISMLMRYS